MCIRRVTHSGSSRLNSIAINEMLVFETKDMQHYLTPTCRVVDVRIDRNFLASGDFGDGGYPGSDLEPGDEFDF